MESTQTRVEGQIRRMTAKHALVAEVLDGSFVRGSGETGEASFVESGGERFSRVCIYGTVVEKGEEAGGVSLAVLDASGPINIKAFDEAGARALQGLNKGDDALVIGRVRETQERFLVAETARMVTDPNWETVHLLRVALRRKLKRPN